MDPDDRPQRPLDAVERQAHAWVVRLTSGEATAADGRRFRAWCESDPRHREAFGRARRQWEQVRLAGEQLPAAARHRLARLPGRGDCRPGQPGGGGGNPPAAGAVAFGDGDDG
ncbi:TPA: FecR/PupR family sigma factor regulator [Stenotrophomonas maltophilia]